MRIFKLLTGFAGFVMVGVAIVSLVAGVFLFSWSSGSDGAQVAFAVDSAERVAVVGDLEGRDEDWGFRSSISIDDNDLVRITPEFDASVTVTGTQPLFIGIGPANDVRRFVDDGSLLPADQDFWVASASGTDVDLDWNLEEGNWAAVLMNLDGSAGIDATVEAELPAAPLRVVGGLASVAGLGIAIVGGYLMVTMWKDNEPAVPAAA